MVEHADKIRSGSIKITADEHNAFTFQPECFSFKFNEIEVIVQPYLIKCTETVRNS